MNSARESAIWWKESVFYQIYMPSFCDSNGDGYSDFKGMTGKLDYLVSLGIKGIWLTPFLSSPKVDNGYDVASYTEVDPTYGSKEDFIIFLKEAHLRGIRVIMDMVLNHTSTDHPWFRESRKSKDNPYRDYYIWKDAPNNWESFFGGSAWELDPTTNQYYYHKFDVRMADLNWSNPKIATEIQEVLRHWLKIGVDGFRMDVINFLTTNQVWDANPVENGKQIHLHDIDQPGVKNAMKIIRSTIDEFDDKFIVGEIGSDKLAILHQYQGSEMMDVVFNFNLGSMKEFSPELLFNELHHMEKIMNGYPTLFFSSHDMPRMFDRLAQGNKDKAIILAALMLTAKGVPFIYYGEEIGMKNITAESPEEIIDIQGITQYRLTLDLGKNPEDALLEGNEYNRDKSRSPMQWNDHVNAGFSISKPWIKINENYRTVNVETLMADKNSIWNAYRNLIMFRNREKVLHYGEYQRLEFSEDRILFTRVFENEKITAIFNFGTFTKIEIPVKSNILAGNAELKSNCFIIYKEN